MRWVLVGALVLGSCGGASASDGKGSGYWYCWNSGAANPHHSGHRQSGDHVCSAAELRAAGK